MKTLIMCSWYQHWWESIPVHHLPWLTLTPGPNPFHLSQSMTNFQKMHACPCWRKTWLICVALHYACNWFNPGLNTEIHWWICEGGCFIMVLKSLFHSFVYVIFLKYIYILLNIRYMVKNIKPIEEISNFTKILLF